MFSILITSLTDKPLLLQGEVCFRSLLGLKGLIVCNNHGRLFYSSYAVLLN